MIISPKDIRFTNEILAVTYGYIFMFRLNYTNRRNVMQKNLFLKVANKREKKDFYMNFTKIGNCN